MLMPAVRVEPSGIEFEVAAGESIAEAAWRHGYTWPTKCWGKAECMVCWTRILDGELSVEPPGHEEQLAMRSRLPPKLRSQFTRLACRTVVIADGLVLEKKGVLPPPPS
jgi:2Fe-2S ferredoxin